MSREIAGDIEYLPWAGYADPSLPGGAWQGQVSLAGDASGGLSTNIFTMSPIAARVSSLEFNVEQISMFNSSTTNRILHMRAENMGRFRQLIELQQDWQLVMRTADTGDEAALDTTFLGGLPLWLGAQFNPSIAAELRFITQNVNLQVVTVTCMGYFWNPGARLVPGGPKRPLQSAFRS